MGAFLGVPALLAAAGDGEHWWVIAPFFWAVWLAALAAILVVVLGRSRRKRDGGDRAREILAERLARGEISTEEFRERLQALS